jgi:hypothetical protein
MRWGEVNKNVNEEDLKCQQKAEHEYDSLFSDTIRLVRKTKKRDEMKMNRWAHGEDDYEW